MADEPFSPAEPDPWWYSRRPRRTLVIGLGILLLFVLRLVSDGVSVIALLLGLVAVFQLTAGVLSVRRDALR